MRKITLPDTRLAITLPDTRLAIESRREDLPAPTIHFAGPTNSGKTFAAFKVMETLGLSGVYLGPRRTLVVQAAETAENLGWDVDLRCESAGKWREAAGERARRRELSRQATEKSPESLRAAEEPAARRVFLSCVFACAPSNLKELSGRLIIIDEIEELADETAISVLELLPKALKVSAGILFCGPDDEGIRGALEDHAKEMDLRVLQLPRRSELREIGRVTPQGIKRRDCLFFRTFWTLQAVRSELEISRPDLTFLEIHGLQTAEERDVSLAHAESGNFGILLVTSAMMYGVNAAVSRVLICSTDEDKDRGGQTLRELRQVLGRAGRGDRGGEVGFLEFENSRDCAAEIGLAIRDEVEAFAGLYKKEKKEEDEMETCQIANEEEEEEEEGEEGGEEKDEEEEEEEAVGSIEKEAEGGDPEDEVLGRTRVAVGLLEAAVGTADRNFELAIEKTREVVADLRVRRSSGWSKRRITLEELRLLRRASRALLSSQNSRSEDTLGRRSRWSTEAETTRREDVRDLSQEINAACRQLRVLFGAPPTFA